MKSYESIDIKVILFDFEAIDTDTVIESHPNDDTDTEGDIW